ncbi:MAG: zinc-ribbon and DUF3426 domain-containing protein [Wenzhouxiangellaceae bacterium]|nr:zinc-ribbon and DUF3426 domain-containing protein [Wenzhouxiangellaceae bacterium]
MRDLPPRAWTRCEHCQSILALTIADLAQAGGIVRCGHCGRTINALVALYPQPAEDSGPLPVNGMPPLLAAQALPSDPDLPPDADGPSSDVPPTSAGPVLQLDLAPDPPSRAQRLAWPLLALVLLAGVVLQLFGPEAWRVHLPLPGFESPPVVSAARAIEVVSRDMHAHPALPDAWVISAVLLNRSGGDVPWPTIDLRLFDTSQQLIAQRRLQPADYLDPGVRPDGRFGAGLRLPVVLQVASDGTQPAGFSMQFHD